ncbi:MAG TPA: hypothetical protein VHL31_14135 [Geminicoccus sp.]|uniref:hypothetical protein n=1 Tax=Geminicoccus sp. TaxID=2024832 RepID=UPI002E3347A2|nr:hypothetical protein [Geminicoccus sp.]HEX2527422.1 hypothetical protein [Geminicoccus sp.]
MKIFSSAEQTVAGRLPGAIARRKNPKDSARHRIPSSTKQGRTGSLHRITSGESGQCHAIQHGTSIYMAGYNTVRKQASTTTIPRKRIMLKFIGGTVGVIFLIGLLVVIGLFALIF